MGSRTREDQENIKFKEFHNGIIDWCPFLLLVTDKASIVTRIITRIVIGDALLHKIHIMLQPKKSSLQHPKET